MVGRLPKAKYWAYTVTSNEEQRVNSMAATNRERQAAFKRSMRDAGMRQVTIWLDPNQEQEVKALLSGSRQGEAETTRLSNWAEKLAQEQHHLDTRWNELDALVAETNLLKDNLKKRERDVSLKPKTASTATEEEIPSHADRVARLVSGSPPGKTGGAVSNSL
jgi:predicted nuclease with TOPRIM domain